MKIPVTTAKMGIKEKEHNFSIYAQDYNYSGKRNVCMWWWNVGSVPQVYSVSVCDDAI
jgi:hypothetical protein